jgi:hypothetical protein
MSDLLDLHVDITVEGGLTAHVRILRIGTTATTEIRCSRRPTEQEQRAIERALEELVRRETGRQVTAESEHFTDERKLRKAQRKHFGGGQG